MATAVSKDDCNMLIMLMSNSWSGLYEWLFYIFKSAYMNTSLKQSMLCMETGKIHFSEKNAILEDPQVFKGIIESKMKI